MDIKNISSKDLLRLVVDLSYGAGVSDGSGAGGAKFIEALESIQELQNRIETLEGAAFGE